MQQGVDLIRRETRELPAIYEPELLKALADGVIQVRRTITEVPGGVQTTSVLRPNFWKEAPSRTWVMSEHNENEYWDFEVHYADLREWLHPTPKAGARGRPPIWDWERFWIEAVLLANTPDGLPDKQSEFEEYMTAWFEKTSGESPAESTIREKAGKLYQVKAGK